MRLETLAVCGIRLADRLSVSTRFTDKNQGTGSQSKPSVPAKMLWLPKITNRKADVCDRPSVNTQLVTRRPGRRWVRHPQPLGHSRTAVRGERQSAP